MRGYLTMTGKILIVEDDVVTRRNLSVLLSDEGYDVDQAGDGVQALEILAGRPFDPAGCVKSDTGGGYRQATTRQARAFYMAIDVAVRTKERIRALTLIVGARVLSRRSSFTNHKGETSCQSIRFI